MTPNDVSRILKNFRTLKWTEMVSFKLPVRGRSWGPVLKEGWAAEVLALVFHPGYSTCYSRTIFLQINLELMITRSRRDKRSNDLNIISGDKRHLWSNHFVELSFNRSLLSEQDVQVHLQDEAWNHSLWIIYSSYTGFVRFRIPWG